VGQPSADDAGNRKTEAICIRQIAAMVEAEYLFIQIPEQVKRFDAHVGPFERTLQERPVVFQPVRVNLPIDVGLGVVDDAVDVAALSHAVVGTERIGVDAGAYFDVLRDDGFELVLFRFAMTSVRTRAPPSSLRCRSSRPMTATLPIIDLLCEMPSARRLLACVLRALPPMNVSSHST